LTRQGTLGKLLQTFLSIRRSIELETWARGGIFSTRRSIELEIWTRGGIFSTRRSIELETWARGGIFSSLIIPWFQLNIYSQIFFVLRLNDIRDSFCIQLQGIRFQSFIYSFICIHLFIYHLKIRYLNSFLHAFFINSGIS